MEVQFLVALVGVGGTALGVGLKAAADAVTGAAAERRRAGQVATTLRSLYRNAFMQLNGAMRIGYVDSVERFRNVLQLAIGRASSDDISTAFPANIADAIHNSVPALFDSLYSCTEAQEGFNALSPAARDDRRAQELLFERIRLSASVGLALTTVVLTEIGDDAYVGANLWKPNGKRILKYINDERIICDAEVKQSLLDES